MKGLVATSNTDRARLIAIGATTIAVLLAGFIVYSMATESRPESTSPSTSSNADRTLSPHEPDKYDSRAPLPVTEKELNEAHSTAVKFIELFATIRNDDDIAHQRQELSNLLTSDAESVILEQHVGKIPNQENGESVFYQVRSTEWITISNSSVSLHFSGTEKLVKGDELIDSIQREYVVTAVLSNREWRVSSTYEPSEHFDDGPAE